MLQLIDKQRVSKPLPTRCIALELTLLTMLAFHLSLTAISPAQEFNGLNQLPEIAVPTNASTIQPGYSYYVQSNIPSDNAKTLSGKAQQLKDSTPAFSLKQTPQTTTPSLFTPLIPSDTEVQNARPAPANTPRPGDPSLIDAFLQSPKTPIDIPSQVTQKAQQLNQHAGQHVNRQLNKTLQPLQQMNSNRQSKMQNKIRNEIQSNVKNHTHMQNTFQKATQKTKQKLTQPSQTFSSFKAKQQQSLPNYSTHKPDNIAPPGTQFTRIRPNSSDMNLSALHAKKFLRSQPIIAPHGDKMAYSEISYIPAQRQTFARLYVVDLAPSTLPPLPEETYVSEALRTQKPKRWWQVWRRSPSPASVVSASRYDPQMTLKSRTLVLSVGDNTSERHKFDTLSVVDWSANGTQLLFKRRSGVAQTGLRTTDLLTYNRKTGIVTLYPEIQQVITSFWNKQESLPPLQTLSWDINPLGWEPGSDSRILFNAWAYDSKQRAFLGIWRYDINQKATTLISLKNNAVSTARNGMTAKSEVQYDSTKGFWYRKGANPH